MSTIHFFSLLIKNLGAISLILFCEYGWGALLLRLIKYSKKTDANYWIYSLALGHGILAHTILAISALGLLYKTIGILVLLISFLMSAFELYQNKTAIKGFISGVKKPASINWFSLLLFCSILLSIIFPLIAEALLPPSNWDEVAYHLAIPKIYIKNHQLTYIPFIPYSNWPLETEMLFILCQLLQWESVAHMVVWSTLLLICFQLYAFGKKHYSSHAGLIAAAIFASTPMVMMLAGTGLIELPLTLFTLLATTALIEWNETRERSLWIISAIFGGLTACTKLNAALVPLILGIVFILMMIRSKEQLVIIVKQFIAYGFIAFLVVSPWYIKSWIYTGNPFWPFLYQLIPSANWDALGMQYLIDFIRLPNMPSTPLNWLTGFIQISLHPENHGPFRIALGEIYLYTLPLIVIAVIFMKQSSKKTLLWLALCAVFFYTSWFLQTHQTRFIMPVTPIIAILAGMSFMWIWQLIKDRNKTIGVFLQLALMILFFSTSWLATPADRTRVASRLPFLLGNMGRNEYLHQQIAGYDAFQYINKKLPESARIWMALYEVRGYYLDREYVWANPISQRAFHIEEFDTASQLALNLKDMGITHILYSPNDTEKYAYIEYGDKISSIMQDLIAENTKLLFQSNNMNVYKLMP